jgi:small-conductance mechanosensitive channel
MEHGVSTENVQQELASLAQGLLVDLREPGIAWQFLALAVCLGLAKLIEVLVRRRPRGEGKVWELGQGSLKRLAFPLAAVFLLLVARPLLKPFISVHLLSLAIPLLGSLAAIRMVFYVLRHSFPGAAWLTSFERGFALMVWVVVALHIMGLLPDVIDVLEAISFTLGKQKLTLWLLLQGLAAVLATMLGALWLGTLIENRLDRAEGLDVNLRVVFARLARALLIVTAVLISLPLVGIDLTMLSVFSGALGVGLGLGLQKIASNYVSGFIILLDRSIRIGNLISVGTDRGTVTRITTRFTVLRGLTGVEALVPNELLVSSVVQNESFSDHKVRIAMPIQISYDSDIERAMAILEAAAAAQERVISEPPPRTFLLAFADSGINLELGFWIADPEEGTGALRTDINLQIWREFQSAGISIPFPQREVRVFKEQQRV